jgi:hypothetical protein
MAARATDFVSALGLAQLDILGFSIGDSKRVTWCDPEIW